MWLTLLALSQLCQPLSSVALGTCYVCSFLLIESRGECKGSFAGVELWILTRFRGIWCVSELKSLGILFMLHEPPMCSSLGRTQPAFWKTGRDSWAGALLSCRSLSLSSEGNFKDEEVENKCYFFFLNIVKRPQNKEHSTPCFCATRINLSPTRGKNIYETVSACVKMYLHQVISSDRLYSWVMSNLLCMSHT